MNKLRDVQYIVLHCSATPLRQRVTVEDIDRWHKAQGWSGIGYHWYIDQDGRTWPGRSELYAGAHVKGHNHHAIGICYEGGIDPQGHPADTRTPAQKAALLSKLKELKARYPHAVILGHRDFPHVHKACPCFNAKAEYSSA